MVIGRSARCPFYSFWKLRGCWRFNKREKCKNVFAAVWNLFLRAIIPSYDVKLSFKPLLERKDWWLLSRKTWTLVYGPTTKAKHIACSNFYICSWICATIGMYKTILTDAKNALTWNTAISTILDTKIPSKIHVTTLNMVLVIWQKISIFGTKVIELCYFLSYQNKKIGSQYQNVIVF